MTLEALSRAAHPAVLFLEVLALVGVGRALGGLLLGVKVREQLWDKDNPAAGLVLGGFTLGLFLALAGLLQGEATTLAADALDVALHGAGALLGMGLAAGLWRVLLDLELRRDVIEARNLGAALLIAASFVATGLIYQGALSGEGSRGLVAAGFFALGQGALFAAVLLYEFLTPYDVAEEVGVKANSAAAVAASGAILAAGLLVGDAVSGDFESWKTSILATLPYLLPAALLPVVRWTIVNGLLLGFRSADREIAQDRNLAVGAVEAAAYVGVAVVLVVLL
jgi:uncharacterized membrane protein YjfL (UPF0719 family)